MTSELLEYVEVGPSEEPMASILWLHGLGADGHDFEPIVPELRMPETMPIRYVFPHAPLRPVTLNGGMVMRAWFDILAAGFPRRVDMEGFLESVGHLERLIEEENRRGVPPEHIVLAGFSQGGSIALHTGLRYEKPLAGILALSTYLPTLDSLAGEMSPANRQIPIMMAHGLMDPMVPLENAQEARDELVRLGYPVEWSQYPMGHAVCPEEIDAVRSWLVRLLGGRTEIGDSH
jgi:phospholipase/carboxylesterase